MTSTTFAIHGHFYQPPREDPRTGEIPLEPGATPYKNWNERINATCYKPNSLLGNFEAISFNVGPTLCDWLIQNDPGTLARIVEQDRQNLKTYGVGNAIAQAYHHTILPLANYEDKVTQVRWGIEDFIHIYGHRPTGMWLPEAAVDQETLCVLAAEKIQFTILAPWQAAEREFNYRKPYLVDLAKEKQITVFFYDADISARVSFDPSLTVNADQFIPETLLPKYTIGEEEAQILLIASDGELYGHHQPFRDKFLERLIDNSRKHKQVHMTYPALFLKQNPAVEKINIRPNTSWSCYHGVSRWAEACGCTPHSEWKAPLRHALNQLGDQLNQVFKQEFASFTQHAFEIRHRCIHVLLGQASVDDLLQTFIHKPLTTDERERLGLLLEAQFERQRMFTSCGWFFDDFDRIEPQNNIAYAAHACWLTYKATGIDLATQAIKDFEQVQSPRSGLRASTVFEHRLDRDVQKVVV